MEATQQAAEQVEVSAAAAVRDAMVRLKRSRIHVSPCHTTRASSLGNECERALFYERTAWQMKAMHGPETQALFDLGNELEGFVLRELELAGVGVVQSQRDYADRRYDLSGRIDCKLVPPGWKGRPLPAEVKGLNPYTAESIESIGDIRESRQPWVRKYFAQLQTYLLLDGSELGLFILLNKVSGQLVPIECRLDYEYAEQLLQKAERIRDAVRADVAPPRHVTQECSRCSFVHVCQPDLQYGPGVEVLDSVEIAAALARRAALMPAHREYEAIDKAVKKQLPHVAELLVGDFVVRGKPVDRKASVIPASTYWKTDIEQLTKREEKP